MNPTSHARIPMMPNKIMQVKHTKKGHLTYSICCVWAWSSSHFNSAFFSLDEGPSFDSAFALDVLVQNSNVHNMVIWGTYMSRRTTIFADLHAKPMIVVQMSLKQPFIHISVDASIDDPP
jgi:hypothetical protein